VHARMGPPIGTLWVRQDDLIADLEQWEAELRRSRRWPPRWPPRWPWPRPWPLPEKGVIGETGPLARETIDVQPDDWEPGTGDPFPPRWRPGIRR
jgi:hypothetical protein